MLARRRRWAGHIRRTCPLGTHPSAAPVCGKVRHTDVEACVLPTSFEVAVPCTGPPRYPLTMPDNSGGRTPRRGIHPRDFTTSTAAGAGEAAAETSAAAIPESRAQAGEEAVEGAGESVNPSFTSPQSHRQAENQVSPDGHSEESETGDE